MNDSAPISDDELTGLFAGLERTPLALAVSGGADSMALMHMVARWAKRDEVRAAWAAFWQDSFDEQRDVARDLSFDAPDLPPPPWLAGIERIEDLERIGGTPHVVVLTVDHGLRPGSADDAAFVAGEARRLGLECLVLRWEGTKPATGIQAKARQARRDLMIDVIHAEAQARFALARTLSSSSGFFELREIVMAHTLEDQVETFLMRLARGSGLEGLGGMRPRDQAWRVATPERPRQLGCDILRPLLGIPKARLVATLQAYGARWVEDPSNEDQRFERVRVRRALGVLGEIGLTAEKIALSARRLRDASTALGVLHDCAAPCVCEGPSGARFCNALFADLDLGACEQDFGARYLTVRSLRFLLLRYGGAARAPELAQIEQLADLVGDCRRRMACGGVTLAGCAIAFHGPCANHMRIYREGSGAGLPESGIAPGQNADWDGGRFTICAKSDARAPGVVRALGLKGWADLKRAVPELAQLKWPAAAAATSPVVVRDTDVVAQVGITATLQALAAMPADACALPDGVLAAWQRYAAGFERGFWGSFGAPSDW